MAAMMLMLTMHAAIILALTSISWPSPLISQLFHQGFLRPHHFFTVWLFLCGFHFFFALYKAPKPAYD